MVTKSIALGFPQVVADVLVCLLVLLFGVPGASAWAQSGGNESDSYITYAGGPVPAGTYRITGYSQADDNIAFERMQPCNDGDTIEIDVDGTPAGTGTCNNQFSPFVQLLVRWLGTEGDVRTVDFLTSNNHSTTFRLAGKHIPVRGENPYHSTDGNPVHWSHFPKLMYTDQNDMYGYMQQFFTSGLGGAVGMIMGFALFTIVVGFILKAFRSVLGLAGTGISSGGKKGKAKTSKQSDYSGKGGPA